MLKSMLLPAGLMAVMAASVVARRGQETTVQSEFVFESAPFPSAHASTIAETKDGLVAAWFGGTRERAQDVGIWVSRRTGGRWSPPVEVANGVQADGTRHPCWNPVLFETSAGRLSRAGCPTASSVPSRTSRSALRTARSSRPAAPSQPSARASGASTSNAAPMRA
jgi:hypothetical protein